MAMRNLYLVYGLVLGMHFVYGMILVARYLRVRTKAAPLWLEKD